MLKNCLMCGKEFETDNVQRKYCKASCKERHRIERGKVETACAYCGTIFMANPTVGTKFCSLSCGTRYGNEHADLTKTLTCIDCGVTFEFKGRTKKKRCDKCRNKFRSNSIMAARAAKDPSVLIGVGSGGGQTPKQMAEALTEFSDGFLFSLGDTDPARDREKREQEHQKHLAMRRAVYHKNREKLAISDTGNINYRDLVITGDDACDICGYNSLQESLEVHHKDFDRSHNTVDNLVILCSNCHTALHVRAKSKEYRRLFKSGDLSDYADLYPDLSEYIKQKIKSKH